MRIDSSLVEVALLLEPRTAELLIDLPLERQEFHLEGIRLFLSMLEEYGFVLDPIERGDRIHRMILLWKDYV